MSRSLGDRPVVIEARGVDKTFRIPLHRVDSLKERATHPRAQQQYRELQALRDISFDVHQGEFFGVVGRNGSGKSTLLKILASIYRADGGRVRMAGRLAPFIELGVGFNPELTARENVVLNGVLMGLTRQEARRRFGAILDFAELGEFADLKLKNYSSGMMVRLAFAVMVQADADIMLIDEVLAVGDASFAQKCMDVFHERRDAGRTIVLVTHDMATVQSMCDRAMLIHDSRIEYVGDPDQTALRYFRQNFSGDGGGGLDGEHIVPDIHADIQEAWLVDEAGARTQNVEQGRRLGVHVVLAAREELTAPLFGLTVTNPDGVIVFSFREPIGERIEAGRRVRIAADVADNPLLPGRYAVDAFVYSRREAHGALQRVRLFDFVVYGTGEGPGMVSVQATVRSEVISE